MIQKNMIIATVAEHGSSQFANRFWRFYPTGSFHIKFPNRLQLLVLFFIQDLYTHGLCYFHCTAGWFKFFSGLPCLTVVTKASSSFWTFRCTIIKNIFTALAIPPHYIRLASCFFHLTERPEFVFTCFQSCLNFFPLQSLMPVHVFLKSCLQR